MKWYFAAFLIFQRSTWAVTQNSFRNEQEYERTSNLRRRSSSEDEEGVTFDEIVIDEVTGEQKRRKLLAIHDFAENSILIRNDSKMTVDRFVGELEPENSGLLDAYVEVAHEVLSTMPYIKYIDDAESIISFVDVIPCAKNCGKVYDTTRCQRLTATFEIGVHPFTPNATLAYREVERRVDEAIYAGDYRKKLQGASHRLFGIQDRTICTTLPDIPDVPIKRPHGVVKGYQEEGEHDMGNRFNKFDRYGRNIPVGFLPMTMNSYYPMNMDDAKILRDNTDAVSVLHAEDCVTCMISPEEMIEASKVVITHPSDDMDSPFWDELWEVIRVQLHRIKSDSVEDLMKLPDIWSEMDIHDAAEAVHNEFPGSHHANLIGMLFGGGTTNIYRENPFSCMLDEERHKCATIDREIIPVNGATDLMHGVVMLADLNTWAIGVVAPNNFCAKWYVGRARPEEVVWDIYNDRIKAPAYIEQTIKQQYELEKMEEFTAYEEGAPEHPSWPAMHAAASGASLWLAIVMDLSKEQWCEVKAVDYAVGYARTIAGVHYYTDTIAGLNIAQEILSRLLPGHLQEKYGSDPDKVSSKIESLRFDWNDYLTSECFYENYT